MKLKKTTVLTGNHTKILTRDRAKSENEESKNFLFHNDHANTKSRRKYSNHGGDTN